MADADHAFGAEDATEQATSRSGYLKWYIRIMSVLPIVLLALWYVFLAKPADDGVSGTWRAEPYSSQDTINEIMKDWELAHIESIPDEEFSVQQLQIDRIMERSKWDRFVMGLNTSEGLVVDRDGTFMLEFPVFGEDGTRTYTGIWSRQDDTLRLSIESPGSHAGALLEAELRRENRLRLSSPVDDRGVIPFRMMLGRVSR